MRALRLWRLALRLSWRSTIAAPGRALVLALLIAVPGAGAVAYASIQAASIPSPEAHATSLIGQAQSEAGISVAELEPHSAGDVHDVERRALSVLPSGSRLLPNMTTSTRFAVGTGTAGMGSALVPGVWRLVDLADPGTRGMYRLAEGSLPVSPGETAISPALAARLRAQVGVTIRAGELSPGLRVSGIVVDRQNTDALIAVSPPSDSEMDRLLAARDGDGSSVSMGWLVFTDPEALPRLYDAAGFSLSTRADLMREVRQAAEARNNRPGTLGVLALTLVESGLLVGAAFAMAARRRVQELGLLAVAGADPRARRRFLTASGVLMGGIAALLTVPVGVGISAALRGPLAAAARQEWESLRLDPVVSVAAPVLVFLAAVLAAWASGRNVASVSAVGIVARSGRVQPPPRRGALIAVLLATSISALLFGALARWSAAVFLGTALALPALAIALGRLLSALRERLGRAGFATRNAFRDAAANPGRSSALATAIAVPFVISLVVANALGGLSLRGDQEYTPATPLGSALFRGHVAPATQAVAQASVALNATVVPFVRAGVTVTSGSAGGTGSLVQVTVDNPVLRCVNAASRQGQPLDVDRCSEAHGGGVPFPIVGIAGESYLEAALGAKLPAGPRAALAAGKAVVLDPSLIGEDGSVEIQIAGFTVGFGDSAGPSAVPGGRRRIPAVLMRAEPYRDLPQIVLTERGAKSYGLEATSDRGLLFVGTTMPSQQQEDRARALLDSGDGQSSLVVERGPEAVRYVTRILLIVGLALVLITLGVVAMAVALSTGQLRQDFATLAAIGAPPRVRRSIAAAQSFLMSAVGVGLGFLVGAAGAITLDLTLDLPIWFTGWWLLLLVAFLTVVAGTAVGALTAPSRLPISRRYG